MAATMVCQLYLAHGMRLDENSLSTHANFQAKLSTDRRAASAATTKKKRSEPGATNLFFSISTTNDTFLIQNFGRRSGLATPTKLFDFNTILPRNSKQSMGLTQSQ